MRQRNRPLARALLQWQEAAGPYWPYVGATPFLGDAGVSGSSFGGDDHPLPAPVGQLVRSAVDHVALFLDMSPIVTLPACAELNRLGFVVVPLIERWVTTSAVIPCEVLARDLVEVGRALSCPANARGVVFLLDGDRGGSDGGSPRGVDHGDARLPPRIAERMDNRYTCSTHRFPPAAFLQAQGIRLALWVCEHGIAPELRLYVDRLEDAGLHVASAWPVVD